MCSGSHLHGIAGGVSPQHLELCCAFFASLCLSRLASVKLLLWTVLVICYFVKTALTTPSRGAGSFKQQWASGPHSEPGGGSAWCSWVKTSASTAKAAVFAAEWFPALLSAGIWGSKATGHLHTSICAHPATRTVLAILSKSRWVSASAGWFFFF